MKIRPKSKNELWRSMARSTQPIYALNAERQIIFANAAVGRWLGVDEQQLLTLKCDYHSRTDAAPRDRLAASLCPPPIAFHGQPQWIRLRPVSPERLAGQPNAPDDSSPPHSTSADSTPTVAPSSSADSEFSALCCPIEDDRQTHLVLVIVHTGPQSGRPDVIAGMPTQFPTPERLHQTLAQLRLRWSTIYRLDRLIGESESMQQIRRKTAAAIAAAANTIVIGPSLNACEQIARTIHFSQYPPGSSPPLIPIDCAVCDAETIQSSLRQLLAERTSKHPGRLLLRQVDRLAPPAQRELAEFARLPTFSIGLLATATDPLPLAAEEDPFDRFLAQHLATIEIQVPPLTERLADLPLVAQSIVEDFNAEGNRQLSGLTPDALELLYRYRWPGDVDELIQIVYEACRQCRGPQITSLDFPPRFSETIDVLEQQRPAPEPIDLGAYLQQVENELMRRAMEQVKGNKTQAARLLGISRQRMIRWAEQHWDR